MPTSSEVQGRLKSIETLIHQIESAADPALAAAAKELVQLLMELHGACLERMLQIIDEKTSSGVSIIEALGHDDLVRSLLLLYGLHPDHVETRVMQALEKVRPYLKSQGGEVKFVALDDSGTVTLHLEGNCHGCPSSSSTLRLAVEEAIYEGAPDVTAIVIQEQSPSMAFVPLSDLSGRALESKRDLHDAVAESHGGGM